ncbi:hypothetical protein V8F20_001500 [Naviculisporaceae sp. PSN 640]
MHPSLNPYYKRSQKPHVDFYLSYFDIIPKKGKSPVLQQDRDNPHSRQLGRKVTYYTYHSEERIRSRSCHLKPIRRFIGTMAFILDDQDPSITSESAPFIQPVDYDSDLELFQVPLKRDTSPLKIQPEDPISKAALQYALKTSSPQPPSEASLSTNTQSQPNLTSRDTSPHKKPASSPPSSIDVDDHEVKDRRHKHSNGSNQKNKILQATKLHLTKSKAKTIQTKGPKKPVLPSKANLYKIELEDDGSEDEEAFARILQWLERCHDSQTTGSLSHTNSHHTQPSEAENAISGLGRAILAGPHLLHPFLGPALFSPPLAEPKVYPINIHGTLAHHTLSRTDYGRRQEQNEVNNMPAKKVDQDLILQEISDRNSSRQTTSDSAYDRAREMEIWLSKHISATSPNVLLKGKAHWFIDANLTEDSHFRLARVARQSAEGFDCLKRHHLEAAGGYSVARHSMNMNGFSGGDMNYTWGPGGTLPGENGYGQTMFREREEQQQRMVESQTAAELAELYRALSVVHTVFGEEMKAERDKMGQDGVVQVPTVNDTEERGRGRHRERYGGAREREPERKTDHRDELGMVRRRSMGSKIGSLRGRRRRRVGS